jgi:hypothetical protein
MKPKPVRKYAHPKYPSRLEIAARPALLHRHQPPAWRKWPELTGAAGLFLLADTARLSAVDNSPKGGPNPGQTNAAAIVAPIFQHGEGRGATGCIVMSPPVFLSEEEALLVIREELGKSRVNASLTNFVVPGVKIKPTHGEFFLKAGKTQYVPPSEKPLIASAADPNQKVAVEFVSERNCYQLGAPSSHSTVQSYDLKAVAASVTAEVQKQGAAKLYFGAFYDPLAGTLDVRKRAAELLAAGAAKSSNTVVDAKAEYLGHGRTALTLSQPGAAFADPRVESRRLLRLQVQDFLKWLQAQGAI